MNNPDFISFLLMFTGVLFLLSIYIFVINLKQIAARRTKTTDELIKECELKLKNLKNTAEVEKSNEVIIKSFSFLIDHPCFLQKLKDGKYEENSSFKQQIIEVLEKM
ncbi:hypothetical protein [Psychrilyobacter atlanticus]|uniref:hypothetical protein n=1 Tax=Psychrilyobacter atlanticus TaxID=271091 RepID=UPI000424D346|nr:hypothetical protein [Psychrilyobacter atlanticus]